MSINRRALGAVLSCAVLVSAFALTGPAQAAVGAKGQMTHLTLTDDGGHTCVDGCGGPSDVAVTVSGWAYNGSTKPYQDVYVQVEDWYPSQVLHADHKDTADQRAHHLRSATVGYSGSYHEDDFSAPGRTVTVCLHARDHGTKQAWRTVQCRAIKITSA